MMVLTHLATVPRTGKQMDYLLLVTVYGDTQWNFIERNECKFCKRI